MQEYKGFFIKEISIDKKVDTVAGLVGGITEWHTFLVNPKTAEQMRVRDVAHAKEVVDTWFTEEKLSKLSQLQEEIKFTENHLQTLKKEVSLKIAALNKDIEDGEAHLNTLKAKLPPRFE